MTISLEDLTGARVLEVEIPPVFYVDDALSAHIRGPVMHVTWFAYRRWAGDLVKIPVVEIIRPTNVDWPGRIKALMAITENGRPAH